MIEAQRSNGVLWRPKSADKFGRCSVCRGHLHAVAADAWNFHWQHKPGIVCRPNDGWQGELCLLLHQRFAEGGPMSFLGDGVAILVAGGPSPPPNVDADELAHLTAGRRVVWLVDGRHAAGCYGTMPPHAARPSYLGTAPWSQFGQTWLARDGVQVFVALGGANLGRRWPEDPERCVWFRPEHPWGAPLRRRSGMLAGLPVRFATGRCFTLSAALDAATIPNAAQAVHPLDVPPWLLKQGQWVRTDLPY